MTLPVTMHRAIVVGLFGFGAITAAWTETSALVALPQTAEEHWAAAHAYEQKARAAAEEAAYHRAMLQAVYKAELYSKAPIRRAYEKMRKHCGPIIRDAERLAKDLEAFAAFHRMQAQDLETSE